MRAVAVSGSSRSELGCVRARPSVGVRVCAGQRVCVRARGRMSVLARFRGSGPRRARSMAAAIVYGRERSARASAQRDVASSKWARSSVARHVRARGHKTNSTPCVIAEEIEFELEVKYREIRSCGGGEGGVRVPEKLLCSFSSTPSVSPVITVACRSPWQRHTWMNGEFRKKYKTKLNISEFFDIKQDLKF